MKKFFVPFAAAVLMFVCGGVQAQTGKIGHVSTVEIMQMLPEMDSVQRMLQDYAKDLQDNIVTMQTEFQNKYAEAQNNQSQWSELIRQTKSKELQDMQMRIQDFMQQAEEEYQRKQQELLAPIMDRVSKAINEVAAEGKFAYVLDASNGTVFFGSEAVDVMPQVKKKLGLPDIPVSKGISAN